MKHLISISIIVVLLAGCRSTKKLTESSAIISNQTETVEKVDVKEETKVNNDKSTYKKTTITETEYEPIFKEIKDAVSGEVIVPVVSHESFVKVIRMTVIEEGTKDNSKIETKKADNSETATKTEDKSKVENSTMEKKYVPIPWGWIFGCLALIAGGLLYITKPKFLNVFLTFIKKLFV